MNKYILISAGLLLAGCGPDPESVRAPASARDMSWSAKEGMATITGSASFTYFNERKLPGYGVALYEAVGKEHKVTCAGHDVQLLPQSPASDPVVDHMSRYNVMTGPKVESADVAPFVRHATCDADAHFTFSHLPAGVWYVVTEIGTKNVAVKEIRTRPDQTTSVTLGRGWHYPPSWRHNPRLW